MVIGSSSIPVPNRPLPPAPAPVEDEPDAEPSS